VINKYRDTITCTQPKKEMTFTDSEQQMAADTSDRAVKNACTLVLDVSQNFSV